MVSTLSIAQPMFVARKRQKLLSRRPAAISRTTVIAISTVRSVLRSAVRDWLPAVPREDACKRAKTALQNAANSAGGADEQALGQLFADEGQSASAQRAADCDLFLPGCATRH